MEKQVRNFNVEHYVDWTYGVSIKKIKKDIEDLEKLGVTSLNIELYEEYGNHEVKIEFISRREETDKEQQERLNKLKNIKRRQEKWELEQLKKLQEKYKNNEQQ
jgi:hypothetical protein